LKNKCTFLHLPLDIMSEMLKIYLYSSFGYYVRKGDIEEKDFRGFFQKREK